MLYGRHVENGTIRLDETLAEIGIDDRSALLPLERTATVAHLLGARSGVYAAPSSRRSAIGPSPPGREADRHRARQRQREPLDFIGVDCAIDNREVETTLLPLARERKIGVLVDAPLGRTRLWARVAGREVPAWAAESDAPTWAQFFLKFVASHPAVTAITPATSRASNMADNLGGAMGRLPNAEQRRRGLRAGAA